MKKIIFIRHAKSGWKDFSLDDIDRPLNNRGKKDAPFMGQQLKARGIQPDLILSSPAKRARIYRDQFELSPPPNSSES